jgi:thiamine biosynthesis lipoprotein
MSVMSAPPRLAHDFASVSMDTLINVSVISDRPRAEIEPSVQRAFDWFGTVERICSRFDPASELMQLTRAAGRHVRVSTLLFEACAFALELAELTGGAFDPTIGAAMEQLGFDTDYRTGARVESGLASAGVSYRDVRLDRRAQTVQLRKPLVLDLNAVAKGLAIDLAARELRDFEDVSVEAGGDVMVLGMNAAGEPWVIGIQHPRADGLLARTLHVTDSAVCTSGDYERRSKDGTAHVLDGRTRRPVDSLASVTVLAPTAMAADGISTAAMALGHQRGAAFLREQGVKAVLVASEGDGTAEEINL